MRPMRFEAPQQQGGDMLHFLYAGIAMLFWAAVIFGLVMLINRYAVKNNGDSRASEDPIEVVKLRYARGEITKDEFIKLKKDLS